MYLGHILYKMEISCLLTIKITDYWGIWFQIEAEIECFRDIQQAIEAMDHKRVCLEYWNSRPGAQVTQHSLSGSSTADFKTADKEEHEDDTTKNQSSLRGLLKKANLEELHSLHHMLNSDKWSSNQGILIQLLDEEIQKQRHEIKFSPS